MWPKEEIPDEAAVFMRVHRNFIQGEELGPNTFRDHGRGMSVDWSNYSTPLETQGRARNPNDNAVISMVVGHIRLIEGLVVEHDPIQENGTDETGKPIQPNRAHSEVLGEKTTERRLKLSRIWKWEIYLSKQ